MPQEFGNGQAAPQSDPGYESAFTDSLAQQGNGDGAQSQPPVQQAPSQQAPLQSSHQTQAPDPQSSPSQAPQPVAGQPQPQPAPAQPAPTPQQPAAPASQPEPQQPQSPAWHQQASQFGVPEGASAEQAVEHLVQHVQRMQPYAQYAQSLLPYQDQLNEFFNQNQPQSGQTQQTPAQPAAEQEPEWDPKAYFQEQWQAPEWKQEYDNAIRQGMVQQDPETGMWRPSPGYEMMAAPVVQGLNQASSYTAQRWQEIMKTNPYEHFYEKLQKPLMRDFERMVEERVEQRLGQQQATQALQSFESQNKHWLYQLDQQGNPVAWTEQGQRLSKEIQTLKQQGVTDQQQLISLGMRLAGINPQQLPAPQNNPQQGSSQPQPAPASPSSFAQPAGAGQAAVPQPTPEQQSQQKQQSFLDTARERAAHAPQSGAFPAQHPGNQPEQFSPDELESVFVSAFQSQNAA